MSEDQARVIRKLVWRIVPFLAVLYVVSYLDRVNVSFAALTMNEDLGISPGVFGWGAGIFFIGYLLFQVPSNLMLERFGPRRWIATIMVAWGVVSVGMGFITDVSQFLIARFLLGVAEAGFFPGVILYLTQWFPSEYRGRIISGFMFAIPVATIVGAPVSSFILSAAHDYVGLQGWRWLFILEGAPALLGALAVLLTLPDKPQTVRWLMPAEREWLVSALHRAQAKAPAARGAWRTLTDRRVHLYAVVYFGLALSLYGVGLWLPQMIKANDVSASDAALLTSVPYIVAAVGMLVWGRIADRRSGAPASNVWIPALSAAVALVMLSLADGLVFQLALLSVTALGTLGALSTFWTVPTTRLPPGDAAVAVAAINSFGNLGGFIGPVMVGWIKEATQSFHAGALSISAWVLLSVILLLVVGRGAGARPATV